MSKWEDKKIFSINDLIEMGFITRKQCEDYIRYLEAKKIVNDMFKGMF